MLELALWLKQNGFRADQVQAFLPSPMATATAMYHSGKNPLRKVTRASEPVHIPKGLKQRRLHKAFLRYHDANNWPMLRAALRRMHRTDLIGSGKHQLIPTRTSRPAPARFMRGIVAANALPRNTPVCRASRRRNPSRRVPDNDRTRRCIPAAPPAAASGAIGGWRRRSTY